jgi:hypothetical protein
LDNAAPARLESKLWGATADLKPLGPFFCIVLNGSLAMATYLIERSLYGAMAAVLIVPELATFFVFVGFAISVALFAGRFAWSLFADDEANAQIEAALIESALIETRQAAG